MGIYICSYISQEDSPSSSEYNRSPSPSISLSFYQILFHQRIDNAQLLNCHTRFWTELSKKVF